MTKRANKNVNVGAISSETVTEESILKKANALGDDYPQVRGTSADLLADSTLMLSASGDAPELQERGFEVSNRFVRLAVMTQLLTRLFAERNQSVEEAAAQTVTAKASRKRLLTVRQLLAHLGVAAGLNEALLSVKTSRSTRLVDVLLQMQSVLVYVRKNQAVMPDQRTVEALLTEADELISTCSAITRLQEKVERADDLKTMRRIERLLLNEMQHLSKVGLAAYEDARRQAPYRLTHSYGRSHKRGSQPVPPPPTNDPSSPNPK